MDARESALQPRETTPEMHQEPPDAVQSIFALRSRASQATFPVLRLDLTELWRLRDAFCEQDPQNRGLNAEEFGKLMRRYFADATDTEVGFVFRLFDIEQTGRLSLKDFMCGFSILCRGCNADRLRYCFAMFDHDGSGLLDEEEVVGALRLLWNLANMLTVGSAGHDGAHHDITDETLHAAARRLLERHCVPSGEQRVTFDEFQRWAEADALVRHWLADIAALAGDEAQTLRERKEAEMVALEIERLGLKEAESSQTASAGSVDSGGGGAHEGSVGRAGDSLSGGVPRHRQREWSQRGGTLYLSSSVGRLSTLRAHAERPQSRPVVGSPLQEEWELSPAAVQARAPMPSRSQPLRDRRRRGSDTAPVVPASLLQSPFAIDYQTLKLVRKIGEGSFAEVWAGEWLHMPVAIKVFRRFAAAAAAADPPDDVGAVNGTSDDITTTTSSSSSSSADVDAATYEADSADQPVTARRSGRLIEAAMSIEETPRRLEAFNIVSFVREVELLSQLRHPNVLLYIGACVDPRQPLCIVSELFPGGSIHDLLFRRKRPLNTEQRYRIAVSVARGMYYLHSSSPQILHRDLKSSNVLVDESVNRIAICDFGLSVFRNATGDSASRRAGLNAHAVGTPYTLAPEVMGGESYTDKADVYSYGMVLWELLANRKPFENLLPMQLMFKVYAQNARPDLSLVPDEFRPLIERCWDREPRQRPDFGHILDVLEGMADAIREEAALETDVSSESRMRALEADLINAAANDGVARLQELLLEAGVSPNCCDYDKRTPLHVAAAEGHIEAVRLLLQHGAEVNARDRWGSTALSEAIRFQHEACARVLREEYGGRVFDRKSHFELIDAVARGDLPAVQAFIDEGIDVCQADYDQRTALHLAAAEGKVEVARLLIAAGADVAARDRWGSTPLQEAIRFRHPETAVYLESAAGDKMRERAVAAAQSRMSGSRAAAETGWSAARAPAPSAGLSPARDHADYYGD